MIAGDVFPLDQARNRLSRFVNIRFDELQRDPAVLEDLKKLAFENKGRCGLMIHLKSAAGIVQKIRASRIGVTPSPDFINRLRSLVSESNVWIS